MLVAGQEVLTSDNVGIKTSLLVTYQVTDPVKAAHETQNWQGDLYNAAQLALRAVAGGVTIEALLGQRLDIGAQLLARVQPDVTKIGINVTAIEVKDVTLPNDLKRAFAEVLRRSRKVRLRSNALVVKAPRSAVLPMRPECSKVIRHCRTSV